MTDEHPLRNWPSREAPATHPADMTPEEIAAAELRWMNRQEYMAACQLRDNYHDATTADREAPSHLPMARQRLINAIADLDSLRHELSTQRRQLTTSEGLTHEVPSPYFCDSQGRGEEHWRTEAAQVKVELARIVKAGPPRDQAELESRCHLRLQEASAHNTADMIAHNAVHLRQAITTAKDMVKLRQVELEDLARRARRFM